MFLNKLALYRRALAFCPTILTARVARFVLDEHSSVPVALPLLVRSSIANVVMHIPTLDHFTRWWLIRGFYEWRNLAVITGLAHTGDTIVEVGANIGTETILLGSLVGPKGRVFAFEPAIQCFRRLETNVQANSMTHIRCYQCAVADLDGHIGFQETSESWNHGVGHIVHEPTYPASLNVPVQKLDSWFVNTTPPAPRILLIDAEGADMRVLRGARELIRQAIPFVIIEWNPSLHTGDLRTELTEWCKSSHYSVATIGNMTVRSGLPSSNVCQNVLLIPNTAVASDSGLLRRLSRRLTLSALLPPTASTNPLRLGITYHSQPFIRRAHQ